MLAKLKSIYFRNDHLEVAYLETQQVKEGVECDIYKFVNDSSKDLAVVRVDSNSKTPLQRVMSGEEIVELFVSGSGALDVKDVRGHTKQYTFHGDGFAEEVTVKVGEEMQWKTADSKLVFYEICTPPYVDGRFRDVL